MLTFSVKHDGMSCGLISWRDFHKTTAIKPRPRSPRSGPRRIETKTHDNVIENFQFVLTVLEILSSRTLMSMNISTKVGPNFGFLWKLLGLYMYVDYCIQKCDCWKDVNNALAFQFLPRELCSGRYMPWPCVCLSLCVCLSQVEVLQKRLNVGRWSPTWGTVYYFKANTRTLHGQMMHKIWSL